MTERPPAVARVREHVTATVRHHEMFEPGQTVLVACSGGPDSTCLLHALHGLRRLLRISLAVFHFDHRLRAGSERDARSVRRRAQELRLPFFLRVAEGAPPRGASVEAWARLVRYAALTDAAREAGAGVAALGHTMDDQAETVLLGLVRGGGLEAVAGMPPVASLPPLGFPGVRPLIETTRREVEAFCRALRLRPVRDPTNRERTHLRNRLRLDVLPFLERALGRGVSATIARTAEHVRGDADYLEALASEAALSVVSVDEDTVRLDAAPLSALPAALAARVVRQALRVAAAASGEWESDLTAAHVAAVLDLASGRPKRRADLPAGLLASREREYIRVSRASPRSRRARPHDRKGRT